MNMAGRVPYEEVVIDGDTSSDDDDAVVVVTPAQSRKRRRQSAIHDDDDEGAASQSSQAYPQPPPPSGGPHAPTNNSRGTTSGTDSIDQEDEDDEVEIIQISTPSSAEAKRRKLTVVDSDEEEHETTRSSPGVAHRVNALQLEPVPRLAASSSASTATPRATRDREATSTGRRSTRIERKREEKARAGPSARKLEFLSLENCLDPLSSSSRRAAADEETEEDDDEDYIVNDGDEEREEEEDEVSSRRRQQQTRRPRARSPPPRGFTTADDEDLDEFIVADDEVEYMDDDEEGVMDEHVSSADELNEEEDADGHALRMTMQSREPSEWFAIYLRYLEECILDDDLDNKIRLSRRNPEYRLFEQAIHHVRDGSLFLPQIQAQTLTEFVGGCRLSARFARGGIHCGAALCGTTISWTISTARPSFTQHDAQRRPTVRHVAAPTTSRRSSSSLVAFRATRPNSTEATG
jgi:hypothetical protein